MDKEIIENWFSHKNELEDYFKNTPQKKYDSYEKLVKLIVKYFLPNYDSEKITVIDDGEYQGTQIFIIPKDKYQPDANEYLYTSNYYGSCSSCDTLLSIIEYKDESPTEYPNEEQVKCYMILCLHLIQKLKPLTDDEFEIEKLEEK